MKENPSNEQNIKWAIGSQHYEEWKRAISSDPIWFFSGGLIAWLDGRNWIGKWMTRKSWVLKEWSETKKIKTRVVETLNKGQSDVACGFVNIVSQLFQCLLNYTMEKVSFVGREESHAWAHRHGFSLVKLDLELTLLLNASPLTTEMNTEPVRWHHSPG